MGTNLPPPFGQEPHYMLETCILNHSHLIQIYSVLLRLDNTGEWVIGGYASLLCNEGYENVDLYIKSKRVDSL